MSRYCVFQCQSSAVLHCSISLGRLDLHWRQLKLQGSSLQPLTSKDALPSGQMQVDALAFWLGSLVHMRSLNGQKQPTHAGRTVHNRDLHICHAL